MGENLNRRVVIPPWLSQGSLNLIEPMREIPKCPERLLPKFYLDKYGAPKDHIKKKNLTTCLFVVRYEDMVCMIFPCTFENKAST
jgi:hypothetical protein